MIRWKEIIGTAVEFVKNLWAFATGRTITFKEYLQLEVQEILGDDNRWWTGENLKRPPTNLDCQNNYLCHEADKLFRKKYRYRVERPWQRKVKEFSCAVKSALCSIIRPTHYKKSLSN